MTAMWCNSPVMETLSTVLTDKEEIFAQMGLRILQKRKIWTWGFEESEVLWMDEVGRVILRRYSTEEHVVKSLLREMIIPGVQGLKKYLQLSGLPCQLPLSY